MKIGPRFYRVYPELALLPDDAQRTKLLRLCQKKLYRSRRFWLTLGVLSMGNALAGVAVMTQWLWIPGITGRVPRPVLSGIVSSLTGACIGIAAQFLWRKPIQRRLREALVERGIPICIHCGYDLRGQTEPRCPECGMVFNEGLLSPSRTDGAAKD